MLSHISIINLNKTKFTSRYSVCLEYTRAMQWKCAWCRLPSPGSRTQESQFLTGLSFHLISACVVPAIYPVLTILIAATRCAPPSRWPSADRLEGRCQQVGPPCIMVKTRGGAFNAAPAEYCIWNPVNKIRNYNFVCFWRILKVSRRARVRETARAFPDIARPVPPDAGS
jgi:hypothetical protein